MILRASFLLSLCGRGKTGSVKDHSLYILSPKGGEGVPGSLMVLLPSLLSLFRSVFYSPPPPLRHDLNKTWVVNWCKCTKITRNVLKGLQTFHNDYQRFEEKAYPCRTTCLKKTFYLWTYEKRTLVRRCWRLFNFFLYSRDFDLCEWHTPFKKTCNLIYNCV